ncbi:MAG: SGNH/GDSL hydrolase family protein [Patescibacteria group bacterium]
MARRSLGIHIRFGEDKTSILALTIVVFIFILFWYFSIYNPPITNYPTPTPEKNVGVVAFGDSLIAGVGARQNGGFVEILAQRLNIEIINLGEAGASAHTVWGNIDEVLEASPRVVILALGTSDAVVPVTPRYQIESRLERIISTLQEAGSAVIILETASYAYGNMYRNVASAHHTALVRNILTPLRGKGEYMFDEVHPNDAGHQIIADKVEPVLRRLIDQDIILKNQSDGNNLKNWLRIRSGLY